MHKTELQILQCQYQDEQWQDDEKVSKSWRKKCQKAISEISSQSSSMTDDISVFKDGLDKLLTFVRIEQEDVHNCKATDTCTDLVTIFLCFLLFSAISRH